MAELPIEIQAALDAYLAARVDDATWEAYVNSLGPGVALDVATVLCAHQKDGAQARVFLGYCVLGDLEAEDEEEREPWGLESPSSRLETAIGTLNCDGVVDLDLSHEPSAENWYQAEAWTALVSGKGWESEGRASQADREAWADALNLGYPQSSLIGWVVAVCRAICFSWSPEWARSQGKP